MLPSTPDPRPERNKPPEDALRHRRVMRLAAHEAVLLLAAGAFVLLMLLKMGTFVTPLILGLAAAAMLWPMRSLRAVQGLLVTTAILLVLYLLYRAGGTLAPFIVTYILAYVFDPVVDAVAKRYKVERWIPSAVVTVLLLGLVVLFFALMAPQLVEQVQQLATGLINTATNLPELMQKWPFLVRLEQQGLINKAALQEQLSTYISTHMSDVVSQVPLVIKTLMTSVGSLIGFITMLVILPVVLFYFLRDYHVINHSISRLLPTVDRSRSYLHEVDAVMGGYMRGQLLISLISAVNVGFWFILFDVPFALLLGVLAGVLNMIPQIGALLTNLVATVIALLFADAVIAKVLIVQAVLGGQALLEQVVLTPKIMSKQVGLHPVLIIITLFVFGHFMGFLGFLIAVPITALLVSFYRAFRGKMQLDLTHYSRPATAEDPPDAPVTT